ncbi:MULTISPECIES: type II toxin-antitoxin system RatA family toxin [unclassified Snodgrassella]|uniref:type II toxin-antitoxin system RatA family toxin n=1 Tax=unclassified Snodgrassella TaxID=2625236 RepID=UPI0018DCA9DF|nr:type II toxin-antitoxin system RatA family toxin [Snodgrassella sp. W8134]MBI0101311.1 type II toxin-antitoxin system RatA family toxin [Snodgrassella sp. W8135]
MMMKTVEKSVLVLHSAEHIFDLVNTVEDYPKFLPWCNRTDILKRDEQSLEAVLYMDYMKIRQSFATRNINQRPNKIQMSLLNGPFRKLEGTWQFTPIDDLGCKIDFRLEYEFSNALLSALIGPVFNIIATTLVDAFIKEANRRYDD